MRIQRGYAADLHAKPGHLPDHGLRGGAAVEAEVTAMARCLSQPNPISAPRAVLLLAWRAEQSATRRVPPRPASF